jgi:DDE superfamily endonuclease/Tc5 transposase DNA-binding domain/Brinker DNA-binding domain
MGRSLKNLKRTTITEKKKRSWNAREKLTILMYLEKSPIASVRNTATKFDIQPNQIRDWRNKREQLIAATPHIKRLNAGFRPKYPALEAELIIWIQELRKQQKAVSRSMVRSKAKYLALKSQFVILYSSINECKWSDKWLDGFMYRHNLSNRRRTTIAQKLPDDLEEAQHEFLSFILYRRIQFDYPQALIGNMDETPMWFDMPNTTTIDKTGARTISIQTCGHEKSHFTVVLSCLADGTKLPPLIIFKLVNIPRQTFPNGIMVRANREGWMNTDEMLWWIENIWTRRALLSKNPRSLLVLDSFRGHLTDPVKRRFNENNTNMAVIPGGLTSKVQPLDVAINKSFKSKVIN